MIIIKCSNQLSKLKTLETDKTEKEEHGLGLIIKKSDRKI